MVVRERTDELTAIFQRLKTQQRASPAAFPNAKPLHHAAAPTDAAATFSEHAQGFSKELAAATATIADLTRLIQRQNVYDEHAPEIGALTGIVKTKLSGMHASLSELTALREESTAGPSRSQANRHSEAVVTTLRSKLVNTSQAFKALLQTRTRAIKATNARRGQFSSDRPTSFESALFRADGGGAPAAAASLTGPGAAAGGQQDQALALASHNVSHFKQRHEAVKQIEQAVGEVSEMFQDFTRLVHEQDETIVRIDADVDEADRDVKAGSNELMRYIASLTSGRGMILKIFAILFVFLLFFGFVVVR
jgi:syntaxin 5